MVKTLTWALCFVIGMILTIPVLLFSYLVKMIFGDRIADKLIFRFTRFWGRLIVLTTGSKVTVSGLEKIPQQASICFIANHQSFFDIPLLMGWLDRLTGFIAKKELIKAPILNGWIHIIHSAFVDRSNPRSAINSINKGSESIRTGHPIAIFPEGTRSKTGKIADFKPGSLKLATNAEAAIVPITIQGTRRIYEETKRIKKSEAILIIHEPIYPDDTIYKDKTALAQHLYNVISSA